MAATRLLRCLAPLDIMRSCSIDS